MTAPRRVQLRRVRGWRLPPNTSSVARPTPYGNLWRVGLVSCGCRSAAECDCNIWRRKTAQECVDEFRRLMRRRLFHHNPDYWQNWLKPLRGKNLACWCPLDQPCHADVLLELANRRESQ